MPLTYDRLATALISLDPFRWPWGPAGVAVPRGTRRIARRLARLAAVATARRGGRALDDLPQRIASVDPAGSYGIFPDLPPLDGRHPVVLAHGPSLRALVPALAAHRDRLYLVAPLRTALRLAEGGVRPDVAVLADVASVAYDLSQQAWDAAPAVIRRSLEADVPLVTEPLAPAAIHAGFARVRLFDDGLGGLPSAARLPFWGSALLPSLCLPLALGATTVGVGGLDMGAPNGPARRTWRGSPMFLDEALEVTHGVLECLAEALPGGFVDLTMDSVAKRGWVPATIRELLDRPAAPVTPLASAGAMAAADVLRHVLDRADTLAQTVSAIVGAGSRIGALAEAPVCDALAALVRQAEEAWADDPGARAALSLVHTPYLRSLWELRDLRVEPRDAGTATIMKARLIGPEIAALGPAFERWIGAIRASARPYDVRRATA